MPVISANSKNCAGCRACEYVCPKGCIQMRPDGEGFLVPVVDFNRCVGCGLCERRCPERHGIPRADDLQKVYAFRWAGDLEVIAKSASGGAFPALALPVLKRGGVVYGAAYGSGLAVRHVRISEKTSLGILQGSKYVQSDIEGAFPHVRDDLKAGREVLFSGTSCQVAGLLSFLGGRHDLLRTVGVLCHGVASPLMFERYLKWAETKYGKVENYNFRSKRYGWGVAARIAGEKKKKYVSSSDPYNKVYLSGSCYRECCYSCRYASQERLEDITICDYWGIQKAHPNFYRKSGVSGVLVNTMVGRRMLADALEFGEIRNSDFDVLAAHNHNLIAPTSRPKVRDDIYKGIQEMDGFEYVEERMLPMVGIKDKLKALIPLWLKYPIKRLVKGF